MRTSTVIRTAACCLITSASFALLDPSAPIDTSTYADWAHDTLGNTLALDIAVTGNGKNTNVTLVLIDKAGVKKGQPKLDKSITSAAILYFEKNWAVLLASTTETTLFYSVKVGSSADVLGTMKTNGHEFALAGKGGIVLYNPAASTCQAYDKAFAAMGYTPAVAGRPAPINGGAYFYCNDGGQAQVWRVKKGLDQSVNANGTFVMINEKKMLCCIEADPVHTLYSYK